MFKKVLVVDRGNSLSLAMELTARNIEVHYYTEWDEDFPRADSTLVGYGFERFGLHLVKDFYSVLKSISSKEKDDWLVLITDTGYGDLAEWLRKDDWAVFGANKQGLDLEVDRALGKKFMLDNGINVARYEQFQTMDQVIEHLEELVSASKGLKFVLKMSGFSGKAESVVGTPEELLVDIGRMPEAQRTLHIGYVVEEAIPGIKDVAVTAFFNGSNFLKPVLFNLNSAWGSYMRWMEENPVFKMGLEHAERGLAALAYKGVIDLNGIFVRKDMWGPGNPKESAYLGTGFTTCCKFPDSRVYTKMIENLEEVLEAVALGKDAEVRLLKDSAYTINAFSQQRTEGNTNLGRIYDYEKNEPERFGVSYDKCTMTEEGMVLALPECSRLFQMIGFGENYFESIKNSLELFEICNSQMSFQHNRRELIQDIRDRIIFLESWM